MTDPKLRPAGGFWRVVLTATQSPMNPKRWMLTLSCGHEVWITATRRPAAKEAKCPVCKGHR